ncbi:MAG: adenylate/guanylate cyclase domain-containing protein [Pseudomonadota bacterium]
MASVLWQGNWLTRTRIITGLILFAYAFFHFINIGLGLISTEAMQVMQEARQIVTRNFFGAMTLYAALLIHAGLALYSLAQRKTLKMSGGEALQVVLGLLIPLQLISHVTQTRVAHELYGVNDEMSYLIALMWNNISIWLQSGLLLVVWVHGCIGLHFWLRLTRWWRPSLPYLIGLAVLVPAWALAGVLTEGRRMWEAFADPDFRDAIIDYFNWPDPSDFAVLARITANGETVFWALLASTAAVYLGRKLLSRRKSVEIRYVQGPRVTSEKGMTLLEMSKANGVPHTALCGGKGRCTTCRVVIEKGMDQVDEPDEAELRALRAVQAAPNTRLACQIRPRGPLTVFRVFRPQGGRNRAHASQGRESQLAILFLDMRGFTARTAGQLPYDVVFLLNRFFDAIVPAITENGGTVDKYLGDGLLAVFDAHSASESALAGLRATESVGRALERFNERLKLASDQPVEIGMALHLGNLVLGEIGSSDHAPRTIIGDTVNAASRLEGEAKRLDVELLVSEPVLSVAGQAPVSDEIQYFELRGVADKLGALAVKRASDLPRLLTNTVSATG